MAIYLDTNVLYSWRTFAELDRLALSIVAAQIGQPIVIPSLVVEEAEESYRRSIQAAIDDFEKAERRLTQLFGPDLDVHTEPQPWPDDHVASWRRRLAEIGEIAPLHGEDAVAAISREVAGVPPAKQRIKGKPGAGTRDAAIWFSIMRDHLGRDEEAHFITKNTRDFLQGRKLKPELLADLKEADHPIHVYPDIEGFLSRLGEPSQDVSVDLAVLKDRAVPAIRAGLRDSMAVPSAVFSEIDEDRRYRTIVKDADPVAVRQARHYLRGQEGVTLVDADWTLLVDCLYQEVDTPVPEQWFVIEDLHLQGQVQVYLPESDGEQGVGQFIAAQMTSRTTVSFVSDGSLIEYRDLSEATSG